MHVKAIEKGYFGGEIREPNQKFSIPDEVWNDEKRRPSWVVPAKASTRSEDAKPVDEGDGGDGDHVGGGGVEDLDDMSVSELREFAKKNGIPLSVTRKAEILQAIRDFTSAGTGGEGNTEPFGDAPEPVRVENQINEALGSTQPDWVPGGATEI
jgi:hypothetical protein